MLVRDTLVTFATVWIVSEDENRQHETSTQWQSNMMDEDNNMMDEVYNKMGEDYDMVD
jgi:hypothetical protein